MLALLYQPLSAGRAILVTVAAIAAVTLYCLAYTALAGGAESPIDGIVWASIYVAPFLIAFEALKRTSRVAIQGLVLAAAIALSLGLHALAWGIANPLFELVERLPAAGLALLLAHIGPLIAARLSRPPGAACDAGRLPLAPEQIDWVAAAGNYVELHAAGRTILHRAPLSAVERLLEPHGFVRIHRSRLVARRAIVRLRPTDILLRNGASLKTGARYRAAIADALG